VAATILQAVAASPSAFLRDTATRHDHTGDNEQYYTY
jgi:hypothetical protein